MIKTVKISNFKSVQDLEIELGRLNVFIGENGCGKTSILEGIAMGAAALSDRLSEEFLGTRIRVVQPNLMQSGFQSPPSKDTITIDFSAPVGPILKLSLVPNDGPLHGWRNAAGTGLVPYFKSSPIWAELLSKYSQQILEIGTVTTIDPIAGKKLSDAKAQEFIHGFGDAEEEPEKVLQELEPIVHIDGLISFLLFAPENHFLRRFEEEGQIRPLGIRGEGLFRHLVELSKEDPETFTAIADHLSLIDWYGGFSIPTDLQFTERRIAITDRFIADTIKDFDQRSANEGFLYLLFYFTLFLSKWTPKFFAIDNVDNALNPRLCAKLVEVLAKMAKEQDKQAILTTHNPAILDGLDLEDDEQRLFVIYRNMDGATKARRIKPLKAVEGAKPVRNSEAFIRGYFGGLPSNF